MTFHLHNIGERVRAPRCRCGCAEPAQPYGTVLDVAPSTEGTYYLVAVITSGGPMRKVFSEGELSPRRDAVSVVPYHHDGAATTWPVAVAIAGGAA